MDRWIRELLLLNKMADKVVLTSVDIDVNKAIKDAQELRKEVERLKNETNNLKKTQGETSREYIEASATLKATQGELRTQENLIKQVSIANKANTGSMQQMKAQLSIVTAEWNKLSKEERINSDRGKQLAKQKLELTNALKKEETATGDARRNVGNYTQSIIEAVNELRKQESELKKNLLALNSVRNANAGNKEEEERATKAIEQNKYELVKVNQELKKYGQNLDITDAEIIDVSKDSDKLSKNIDKTGTSIKKSSSEVGKFKSSTSGASSALGSFVPGVGQASNAARTFGTILKVALGPIGLIIAAIAALTAYFKRSEEGQDSFNKVIKVFQVVLNNVLDVIGKVGEALFKAVENPKQAWQDFKDLIKGIGEFFKDTFGNVIGGSIQIFVGFLQKAFANIGLAWQKLKGIFVDNSEKINKAQAKIDEFNKKIQDGQDRVKEGAENLGNGIKNTFNKAKKALQGFISEQQKEIDIAKRLANQQAALDRQIRKNIISESKDRAEIAKLRVDAVDKENKTNKERLDALNKAVKLEEKILERNIDIAKQKAYIKAEQNKLSASTKEDLNEEANLRAEIFRLEQSSFQTRKRLESERITALKEVARESVKQLEIDLELYKQNNKYKLEDLQETFNREKAILDKQLEKKLILENDYNLKLAQLKDEYADLERDRELERIQTDYENNLILAEENIFATLELERQGLELKRQQEIEAAEKIGADVNLINDKYSKAAIEIKRAEEEAKLSLASEFAGNIATILGEQTALGKLAAVAQTSVDTYRSATGAFTSFVSPPVAGPASVPLGYAAAGAAIASGLANVKKILSVKSGLPGESSGGGGTSVSPGSATTTPAVTTVNPEIGKGIISRDITDISKEVSQEHQKILVVDEVTANQTIKSKQNKTATV